MSRSRNVLLSALILLVVVGTVSRAEIPQVISYQGKVTDASGNPVANGSYTMRFRIYNAVTVGTLLWDSGDRSIAVAGGVFSVLLGESPQPALSMAFDADYWLLVTFSGVDQSPRQRLASAGYAYMASGLVAGTIVSGSLSDASAIVGNNTATTGLTHGIRGESASTAGRGVFGTASAASGPTYGVRGESASTAGCGVYGGANATSGTIYGVFGGSLSTDGRGVYGSASGTSGTTYGVYGQSNSTNGRGVYGTASATTGTTYGVHGKTASPTGRAVYGEATATSGLAIAGYFESASPMSMAVFGYATSTTGVTYGVCGQSSSTAGISVYGKTYATTGPAFGVRGESDSSSGYGVFGYAMSTTGTTYGVAGSCASPSGFGGYFTGRLRATASISSGATPDNHVALVYNSSTASSPDVLCLKVGYTGNPSSTINYLTFLKGDDTGIGAVEGDNAGGVTFLSGGSDYAEYLPRMHGEALEPGDVVGVFDGKVTKRTEGASQVMVVSTRPIVVGNSPGEEKEADYARVAFIGQVEVKVRGSVQAGDLLMPSGMDDGTAVAVSRDEISAEQFRQVFGQAWKGSDDDGVKQIRAAVGLLQHDPSVVRLEAENRELRVELQELRQRVAALEESQ